MATLKDLADPAWRYDNLYTVETKDGKVEPFKMNAAQRRLWEERHKRNLILKARQLGFTTFIQIVMLDACIFHPNTQCGVIAHNRDDAEKFFRVKIRDVYKRLPEAIRSLATATEDSAKSLTFSNGSSIRVGTSMRSGTLQYLHVSEYGKICAKYPDKAKEIRTGALNALAKGQVGFIESTAEGQEGDFYELVQAAQARDRLGQPLTDLDWKLHFYPWHAEPAYSMDPRSVIVSPELERYFDALEIQQGIQLTKGQAAWYAKMVETQRDDMKREYPSTVDEAFEAAIEGAWYAHELAKAQSQRRIGEFPHDKRLGGVWTFHDIGRNDDHVIWFAQADGGYWRFIHYYENSGHGAPFYARQLQELAGEHDWTYAGHVLPHDGRNTDWSVEGRTRAQVFEGLGVGRVETVRRTQDVRVDIERVRDFLSVCCFDRQGCAQGLKHLQNYRREWDDARAVWKDTPRHDQASHGADGFRTAAMADLYGLTKTATEAGAYYEEENDAWTPRRSKERRGASSLTGY